MSQIKTCVSLYSLQYEYLYKRMTLEDIFRFLSDNGVDGVEVLPDQMIKGSPEPDDREIENWRNLCEKYSIKPVISDVFCNTNLYNNRTLTKKECVKLLEKEIILAHKLGMNLVRFVSFTPAFVLEPLLPVCEKYDVRVADEIHAGLGFDMPKTREFIDEMRRLNSPYIGLVIDTGIFCKKNPRVMENYCLNMGTNPKLVDIVHGFYEKGKDGRAIRDEKGNFIPDVLEIAKTGPDFMFANFADGYENTPLSVLDEYMPNIFHFHFKLFEMTDNGEYSMDYKEILQYLHDKGYDGYVSTEYEGNRWTLPGLPTTEKEQVLLHQKFIKKCIREIEG